jgi:hypothetical protein
VTNQIARAKIIGIVKKLIFVAGLAVFNIFKAFFLGIFIIILLAMTEIEDVIYNFFARRNGKPERAMLDSIYSIIKVQKK